MKITSALKRTSSLVLLSFLFLFLFSCQNTTEKKPELDDTIQRDYGIKYIPEGNQKLVFKESIDEKVKRLGKATVEHNYKVEIVEPSKKMQGYLVQSWDKGEGGQYNGGFANRARPKSGITSLTCKSLIYETTTFDSIEAIKRVIKIQTLHVLHNIHHSSGEIVLDFPHGGVYKAASESMEQPKDKLWVPVIAYAPFLDRNDDTTNYDQMSITEFVREHVEHKDGFIVYMMVCELDQMNQSFIEI